MSCKFFFRYPGHFKKSQQSRNNLESKICKILSTTNFGFLKIATGFFLRHGHFFPKVSEAKKETLAGVGFDGLWGFSVEWYFGLCAVLSPYNPHLGGGPG